MTPIPNTYTYNTYNTKPICYYFLLSNFSITSYMNTNIYRYNTHIYRYNHICLNSRHFTLFLVSIADISDSFGSSIII